ncbi:extracellular solute-binding protein [Paenibacillus sp. N3/727]|uniref:extracellular solute-binding protein n=1 Tax=Paenibacillus sp. N3/727 TaxID=2925845 RepID=UPI001F52C69E|nr:extracellular solute-binding protein [Paenibacillus sp. N3/727]UNK19954.1 extracellular solute-binding protein [Paenibacillus sp. N3/727]
MKRKTRLLSIIFVTAFFISGCGLIGSPSDKRSPTIHNSQTISIVISNLGMTFPSGMDENDNRYLNYIEEETGLEIKVTTPPTEVYNEKLDVIMSSGNLPDMIHVYEPVWFGNYAKQGAFMPLDDLIDRYGPNLKEKIPAEIWDRVRYGGKIYAVPSLNEVSGVELVYARKDWLDRLGIKPPVTLDEYYEVIRAFTQDDPDGNGIDDTIGLTFTANLGRSSPFFGAFGTQINSWFERNGKLVNGNILPETKEALAYLAKLYKEGLLDREFPLNLQNNLYEKIKNGTVGLFSAAWYDTRGPIADNMKKDPNAQWIALEYPTGQNGLKGVYDKDIIRGYNVIPAGSKNAKSVIQMLDFIVSDYKNLKLGFQNEIWHLENGKMVTNFEKHDEHLYRGIYQSLVDVPDPVLFRERLDSLGDFQLYTNLEMIKKNVIKNKFYGIPTPAMSKYDKKLDGLQDIFTRIIMGIEPIDSFDTFVERWKQEGGDEITKEVNEWYRTRGRAGLEDGLDE